MGQTHSRHLSVVLELRRHYGVAAPPVLEFRHRYGAAPPPPPPAPAPAAAASAAAAPGVAD